METQQSAEKSGKEQVGDQYPPDDICTIVEPGICGFPCLIRAYRLDKRIVAIQIDESECKQIQSMSRHVTRLSLRELFMPLTQNVVYVAAEQSGCHASCVVPAAVLKTAEVAMEMALPQEVQIQIDKGQKK